MKLTIEHLAPYLPYGIKGYFLGRLDIVTGFDNDFKIISSLNHGNCLITDFKPILRPLSDLTKEIDHNREKFTVFEKLGDDYVYLACGANLDNHSDIYDYIFSEHKILELPYLLVQKLISWHFDVFSLLDNGLAINYNDINTLKP